MLHYIENDKKLIDFDPRVKFFLLIVTNLVMINVQNSGVKLYVKFILFGIIFLLLLFAKRRKIAFISLFVFMIGWALELYGVLNQIHGLVGFIAAIIDAMIIRMYPCFLAGYYIISTTVVSKFVEGFRKLKFPEQINLPLAVVFRFIPTTLEERNLILRAMKIRNIKLRKGIPPLKLLEYKYIPLMMSILKIGDELTISALTKGLSIEHKRSCIYNFSLKLQDYLLLVILIMLLFVFTRGAIR